MSDFSWPIHVGTMAAREPRFLRAQFGNGYVQIGIKGLNSGIGAKINWRIDNEDFATVTAIDTFLRSKIGQRFTFSSPTLGEVNVFVPEEGWSWSYSGPTLGSISGVFEVSALP